MKSTQIYLFLMCLFELLLAMFLLMFYYIFYFIITTTCHLRVDVCEGFVIQSAKDAYIIVTTIHGGVILVSRVFHVDMVFPNG